MASDERVNKRQFDALFDEMLKVVPAPKPIIKGGVDTPHHEQQKVEKLLVKLSKIKPNLHEACLMCLEDNLKVLRLQTAKP